MSLTFQNDKEAIDAFHEKSKSLIREIHKVIVGQDEAIELCLNGIFSGGHCLLIGVPGLAKTLLIHTISDCLGLQFSRIQFTPDLMPGDITGTEILDENRKFRFIPGPVFANILLADEINRTPPKTQSALLEAMQERQVTAAGKKMPLPDPFFVLATQNPIEQEGTYPLPEAQLDRFLFSIWMDYPSRHDELIIVKQTTGDNTNKPEVLLNEKEIFLKWKAQKIINAKGKYISPGFHDAHAHFYGLAMQFRQINLKYTPSWNAVLDTLKKYATTSSGWILARGWDQNDWPDKHFPDNHALDSLFPDRPVFLIRIDGHAAIANSVALRIAGLHEKSKISGGQLILKNGKLSGVLIDNAMEPIRKIIPSPDDAELRSLFLKAQQQCLKYGITSVTECGIDLHYAHILAELQKEKKLFIRFAIFLSDHPQHLAYLHTQVPETDFLTICGIKVYADGALGSRGACLLQDYSDLPGHKGFLLSSPEHIDSIARILYKTNKQLIIHAIGDSAVRTVLNIYSRYLKPGNTRNWRIEHCQVVHPVDLPLFKKLNVIPSVQPIHAISDSPWAIDRLGENRIRTAYAYRDLLNHSNYIVFGTDFPVEEISPLKNFAAAVFRKSMDQTDSAAYFPEQAIQPEKALLAMTRWACESVFFYKTGSLERGKKADFIITDIPWNKAKMNDLRKDNEHIFQVFINGRCLYTKE